MTWLVLSTILAHAGSVQLVDASSGDAYEAPAMVLPDGWVAFHFNQPERGVEVTGGMFLADRDGPRSTWSGGAVYVHVLVSVHGDYVCGITSYAISVDGGVALSCEQYDSVLLVTGFVAETEASDGAAVPRDTKKMLPSRRARRSIENNIYDMITFSDD